MPFPGNEIDRSHQELAKKRIPNVFAYVLMMSPPEGMLLVRKKCNFRSLIALLHSDGMSSLSARTKMPASSQDEHKTSSPPLDCVSSLV